LELDKLDDNPSETQTKGWNFLQNTRNTFEVKGKEWLYERALEDERLRRKFIRREQDDRSSSGDPDIQWSIDGVRDYYEAIKKFKEWLLVLVHMTAGAPARGTEVVSIQYENGVDDKGHRGIFVEGGLVSFITSYHKGYSASKKVKIIHRYVPKEVSEIVVYYLWLVQPFVKSLQMVVQGQNEFKAFLWEPKPEEEWSDGEDEGSDEDAEEIRIDPVVEWGDDENEEMDDDIQVQGQQGRERQEPSNPDGFWDTDRVRSAIQKAKWTMMKAKISTSMWRHIHPAIHRELTRSKEIVQMLDLIYENKDKESRDANADQSGHTKEIEERIYGRELKESPFHTMSERQEFRK
ncbi:hypothetical protein LTR04_004236, partial [Oleoguttula sp. CCFEE 6159]